MVSSLLLYGAVQLNLPPSHAFSPKVPIMARELRDFISVNQICHSVFVSSITLKMEALTLWKLAQISSLAENFTHEDGFLIITTDNLVSRL